VTYGRSWRWHIVMWFAHRLHVQVYAHWSEAPQGDIHPKCDSEWCGCSKPDCPHEATVNICGSQFCDEHQLAIRAERLQTGRTGAVLEKEGI